MEKVLNIIAENYIVVVVAYVAIAVLLAYNIVY